MNTMSNTRIDNERAASILVEAIFYGELTTANRWGISPKTIQRYRERLNEDDKLSVIVQLKKREFERDWVNEVPGALRSGIRFLQTAFQQLDPANAENVHAVAGAIKLLTEVQLTKQVIDARYLTGNRTDGEAYSQVDALPAEIIEIE